jgi:hypothetical protein
VEKPITLEDKVTDFKTRREHAEAFRIEIEQMKKQGEKRESNTQLNSMLVFIDHLDKDVRSQISKLMSYAGTGPASESATEVGQAIEMAYQLANAGFGPDHMETKRLQAMASLRG